MSEVRLRHAERCMGTVFSFVVVGSDDASVLDPALGRLHQIDAVFSTYRDDSPVSRLGRGDIGIDDCPPDVAHVLDLCAQATRDTGGWFSAVAAGRLDPSGLVKGWAVDEASRLLSAGGHPFHCINGGGDVFGAGGPWRIGVEHPRQPGQLLTVVAGTDIAVATSGTGQRGAHIIDPYTRRPATALASVTVVGRSLTRADVLATAACARGLEAPGWLAHLDGYDSLVVRADGTTWSSAAMSERLAP
ncbi:MAG: FAD:protein FMN transferase, partial [Mycobacteriales bacterium]